MLVARWLQRMDYKSRISYCAPCLGERYSVSRVSLESFVSDWHHTQIGICHSRQNYRCKKCISPTQPPEKLFILNSICTSMHNCMETKVIKFEKCNMKGCHFRQSVHYCWILEHNVKLLFSLFWKSFGSWWDLVVLRLVGEDRWCQDDLLIYTFTPMRSVYCCHHLKQKQTKICVVVFENDWFVVIWFCLVLVRILGIVNKVMAVGVLECYNIEIEYKWFIFVART